MTDCEIKGYLLLTFFHFEYRNESWFTSALAFALQQFFVRVGEDIWFKQ